MIIIHVFENATPVAAVRTSLEELFDTLINQYYSENKVISTASSPKEDA